MAPYIRFLLLLMAVLFHSCKGGVKKAAYALPPATDINDVVQAVLSNKTYPIPILPPDDGKLLHSDSSAASTGNPLSVDLCRLRIIPPPPKEASSASALAGAKDAIYVTDLMQLGHGGKPFFSGQDSAYLLFQSDSLLTFQLSRTDRHRIRYTNRPALDSVYRATGHIAAFECSIPVFSADHRKAYLTLTYQCEALCAYSVAFMLEKKGPAWQVLKGWTLWIS